jgi:hypothetical protein
LTFCSNHGIPFNGLYFVSESEEKVDQSPKNLSAKTLPRNTIISLKITTFHPSNCINLNLSSIILLLLLYKYGVGTWKATTSNSTQKSKKEEETYIYLEVRLRNPK